MAANATINTGGGGGGGGGFYNGPATGASGGYGGSGVVIISQPASSNVAITTGSPIITYVSNKVIYKFNQSGTIRWV
jgi:hypothetical protein